MLLRCRGRLRDEALVTLLRNASCRHARHHPATATATTAPRCFSHICGARPPRLAIASTASRTTPPPPIVCATVTKRHASKSAGPEHKVAVGSGSGSSSGSSIGSGSETSGVSKKKPKKHIAILGGGITGLTTAHYLARYAGPDVHITLYEASDRLGGWLHSSDVSVGGKGAGDAAKKVLFQHGPRVLRSGINSNKYDDLVLYDVIAGLNIQDALRHRQTGARYIYYPDHLVRMPALSDFTKSVSGFLSEVISLLREPLWDGFFKAAVYYLRMHTTEKPSESASQSTRADGDESVGALMMRTVFGDDRPVRNIVSGMLHGIYGGDAWKLSAKHTIADQAWWNAAFPRPEGQIWMQRKDWFLILELIDGRGGINANSEKVIELAETASREKWNMLAFEDGLLTLLRALVNDLEAQPNITIRKGQPVTSVSYNNSTDNVSVTTPNTLAKYDHVISTIFSQDLHSIAKPANSLPSLGETHAVSIMVVNLFYPGQDFLANNHGFGYLVPTSTPNNDEGVLGVIFDSDLALDPQEPHGTKLTVMLGGHLWDQRDDLPDEETGIQMARDAMQKQLGIGPEAEVHARAKLCRECLPQHFVGHRERMAAAHGELLRTFHGRVSVAGPSYTNVGVLPAMRAGWEAALRVARPGRADVWFGEGAHSNTTDGMMTGWKEWNKQRQREATAVGLTPERNRKFLDAKRRLQEKEGSASTNREWDRLLQNEASEWSKLLARHAPLDRLQAHTGLEEFSVPEAYTMIPVWKMDTYFRSWSHPEKQLLTHEEYMRNSHLFKKRFQMDLLPSTWEALIKTHPNRIMAPFPPDSGSWGLYSFKLTFEHFLPKQNPPPK